MSVEQRKKIVVIGATSHMAHACLRLWNHAANDFVLVVRNQQKGLEVLNDLKARNPESTFDVMTTDFTDAEEISTLIENICKTGAVDIALIAHGYLPEQADCEKHLKINEETLIVNGVSPVLFAEAFAKHMELKNHGSLAVIGSVAGDRGRKSNYVYGAAKGLVSRYVEGLQHRLSSTNVIVTLIKPGPTLTPMTSNMEGSDKFADPIKVAAQILDGIAKKQLTIYTPKKWQLIMLVIKHLPVFIFNKLDI